MVTLRHLSESDIPPVVALFERVYPEHRWPSRAQCEGYFREMLFANPWRDLDLPSWIAEENGRLLGFVGIVPRPMRYNGRAIRVAAGCQFMVDPDQRQTLTALKLVKAVLSGPQDLFIADGANDEARRVWLGIGGTAPLLYSMHWTRILRPAQYLISLAGRNGDRLWSRAARPLAATVDALAPRLRQNRFHRDDSGLVETELEADVMSAHLADVCAGTVLNPVYDARALEWLLDQIAQKSRYGTFRGRAVYDGRRELVGWYVHYVRPGAVSEVVQLAARNGAFEPVLQKLLADGWRHGAVAVRGRMDPRLVQQLSDRHCWFRREGAWTLAHSRNADLTAAFDRGEAFLSRMDGEWWLRFQGG